MASSLLEIMFMGFPERLAAIRKEKGFTQQIMADKIGIHVSQLKRYEAATSQPTLEVFKKITLALNVSADMLLFDKEERGPASEQLKLQFEAVSQLETKEREAIMTMIDGILLMHDARRYTNRANQYGDKQS